MSIKKPNFFILGAAKSGTTSLYYYLKQHPSIFMPSNKEPTLFTTGFKNIAGPIEYFELFDQVKEETVIGEASHAYLTTPKAAKVLKGLFPDAKFIVILRDPAKRAHSLYHHMVRWGYEWIGSFERALEVEEERFNSRQFQDNCPQYFHNYLYFRSGLYGEQLQRYFSLFPREQFYILKFDTLVQEPKNTLKSIFDFLEINSDFTPKIKIKNEGKITARIPQLHFFGYNKIQNPSKLRSLAIKILTKINMKEIPPMREETREDLLQRYEPDLKLLNELTGINFLKDPPSRSETDSPLETELVAKL